MNLGNVALKSAHVRKILLTAEGCEDKLEKIHTLVGLPYEKSTGNDVPALDATQDGEASFSLSTQTFHFPVFVQVNI